MQGWDRNPGAAKAGAVAKTKTHTTAVKSGRIVVRVLPRQRKRRPHTRYVL